MVLVEIDGVCKTIHSKTTVSLPPSAVAACRSTMAPRDIRNAKNTAAAPQAAAFFDRDRWKMVGELPRRAQLQSGDASRQIEARLPLHRNRLQGHGAVRSADQHIRTDASANRRLGGSPAIMTGERA
jgi:hypothetical protein